MAGFSISHWGVFTGVMTNVSGTRDGGPAAWMPLDFEPLYSFDGPAYADRVNGKLTFRDWDHWTPEDRQCWRNHKVNA